MYDADKALATRITWWPDDNSGELRGASSVWEDGGSLLEYVLRCPSATWLATFEGDELARGTLQECMAAVEAHDAEGVEAAKREAAGEEG